MTSTQTSIVCSLGELRGGREGDFNVLVYVAHFPKYLMISDVPLGSQMLQPAEFAEQPAVYRYLQVVLALGCHSSLLVHPGFEWV
jgi:hypothetical protein